MSDENLLFREFGPGARHEEPKPEAQRAKTGGLTKRWRVRRRAREEVTRRRVGSVKDDGPTGQRGSDPSAYRFSITGYYNILQGIKPETTQKTWILLSNAHITKYSTRTATITVKLKIKHKSTMNMRRCYIYMFYLLTYFHNSAKKEHITKYSIKSKINSTEAKIKLSFQNTAPELQPSIPWIRWRADGSERKWPVGVWGH